ncbi:GNAT family N-acetyltransferase [Pseudoalteromonas luteoviolacea]|uniref:N-acetyltransferase domain-containing protein n=1 Tax=Pseudoalteromonas luteoviolacea S4060-1 TaxID=1365257 RepID=A0A167L6P4_9GAMM|nr:GNAT family N-acetyltransferase [Pseudoalteromonas luteoviolacea]KZN63903.1 hypothetical protein N478_23430 [Pseudoalteromonas luteoviolacea S4060-1]
MSQIEIKEVTQYSQEAAQIAKWYFEQWDSHRADASYDEVLALVTSTDDKVGFYACLDGALAGAAEIKYRQGRAWLDGVYVDAQYRGLGISNALVDYAKMKSTSLNWQPLYLKCEPHLVRLYEKCGFKVTAKNGEKSIMAWE